MSIRQKRLSLNDYKKNEKRSKEEKKKNTMISE